MSKELNSLRAAARAVLEKFDGRALDVNSTEVYELRQLAYANSTDPKQAESDRQDQAAKEGAQEQPPAEVNPKTGHDVNMPLNPDQLQPGEKP